jgi:hypothetical protein
MATLAVATMRARFGRVEPVCGLDLLSFLYGFRSGTVISKAFNEHPVWRSHGQEAKRGAAGGHRITRNVQRLDRFPSRV